MGWSESLRSEMQVLNGARWSAFILCVTMLGLGFGASQMLTGAQVAAFQATVKMLETENAGFRSKLVEKEHATPTIATANASPAEPKLSEEQLSSLNASLKASKGTVMITTGDETPKVLAQQILGAFLSNGWTVQPIKRRDTFNYIYVEPTDSPTTDIIKAALKDAKIDNFSTTSNHTLDALVFIINTRL